MCGADVEPVDRPAAATLSSVSLLLGQSLAIVVATLTLAASKAAAGRQPLLAEDFQIAFAVEGAIGLLSVLRLATLAPPSGEEVSGRVR